MPDIFASPLSEVLPLERIQIAAGGLTKSEALDRLVAMLSGSPGIPVGQAQLKKAVLAREELMTTGIGLGLAFPHVRLKEVTRIAAAALLVKGGIDDYDSMDKQPVRFLVMILAPEGQHKQYLRLLAQIASRLRDPAVEERLFNSTEPKTVHGILVG